MVSRMDEMGLETDEVAKRSVKRSRSRMADRIAEDEEASAAMERKKSHSRKPQKMWQISVHRCRRRRGLLRISVRGIWHSADRREKAIVMPQPVCKSISILERERMELITPGRIAFILFFYRFCLFDLWMQDGLFLSF